MKVVVALVLFFVPIFALAGETNVTPEQAADLEELLGDNFALLKDAEHFDFDKLQTDAFAEIDEQDWDWKDLAKSEVRSRLAEAKADLEKLHAMKADAPALLQTSNDVEEDIKQAIADDSELKNLVEQKDWDDLEAKAKAKIDAQNWSAEEKEKARAEVNEHIAVERKDGDGAALLQEAQNITPEQAADLEEILGDNFELLKDAEHLDFDKLQADAFAEIDEQDWDWKDLAKNEVRSRMAEAKAAYAKLQEMKAQAPALLQTSNDEEEEIKQTIAEDAELKSLVEQKDWDDLEAKAKAKIDAQTWSAEEKEKARSEVASHIAEERKEGDGEADLANDLQFLFDD